MADAVRSLQWTDGPRQFRSAPPGPVDQPRASSDTLLPVATLPGPTYLVCWCRCLASAVDTSLLDVPCAMQSLQRAPAITALMLSRPALHWTSGLAKGRAILARAGLRAQSRDEETEQTRRAAARPGVDHTRANHTRVALRPSCLNCPPAYPPLCPLRRQLFSGSGQIPTWVDGRPVCPRPDPVGEPGRRPTRRSDSGSPRVSPHA